MNRTLSQKNLPAMFTPRSIAVIGASRRQETVGYAVLDNLLKQGYQGRVYPVNPKAETIEGVKCYSSVTDIDDDIDLAVIITPSKIVPQVMEQCGESGVRSAIVISAGFREIGEEGQALEEEVKAIAHHYGIAVMGPNCLGLINTDPAVSMNASFARVMPAEGNIAFISQSGALCTAILDYAKGQGIGFSKFISFGNKADIAENDLLEYLRDDPQTKVVLMYLEDIIDGREFIKIARTLAEAQKPILVLKSGRTKEGAKAASSHTGSLMGADEVYDAIFKQANVMRVDSIGELFNYAIAFSYQPLPRANRVAVVTNAGGPGIMTTDSCISYGLTMAKFSEPTAHKLKQALPPAANIHNPIDVIGDARADRYAAAVDAAIEDPGVDGMIVLLTPQSMTEFEATARLIVEAASKTDKPILTSFMGSVDVQPGVAILEANGIPHYHFPGDAAQALGAMARYEAMRKIEYDTPRKFSVDKEAVEQIIRSAQKAGESFLTIDRSMDIFKAYGFPLLPYGLAQNPQQVAGLAQDFGEPVALKLISKDIVHKFDVGAVQLNLKTADEAQAAAQDMLDRVHEKMPEADIDGIFVQAMAGKGKEVILGMNSDPHFGPIIMFGLGGIYVEALKDVTFGLAPLQHQEALGMVKAIDAYPLLEGVRGEPPVDQEMIAESIQRLSQLALEHPAIKEVDINPILVYQDGSGGHVVDARIILADES
ncbi:MAG: acetate--CoA ligase alpha subunit [Chlamydiota bacterium]